MPIAIAVDAGIAVWHRNFICGFLWDEALTDACALLPLLRALSHTSGNLQGLCHLPHTLGLPVNGKSVLGVLACFDLPCGEVH